MRMRAVDQSCWQSPDVLDLGVILQARQQGQQQPGDGTWPGSVLAWSGSLTGRVYIQELYKRPFIDKLTHLLT